MNVFLSYAHSDERVAQSIAEGLKRVGLNVWYDRQILPGSDWADQVSRALRQADAMVVLVSPGAAASKQVHWEIDYALGQTAFKNRLIPVIIGPQKKIPKKEFPWILWELQAVTVPERGNQEPGIRQIAQALQKAA